MGDETTEIWIDPSLVGGEAEQAESSPIQGEVLIAPGQAALFPDQPDVLRWKDAESDPDHQAIDVGPNASCTCGWKGAGFVQHLMDVKRGK